MGAGIGAKAKPPPPPWRRPISKPCHLERIPCMHRRTFMVQYGAITENLIFQIIFLT